ncbi:MBL fold metallo-hydrolase RNA specificity domain-containing protein, partial [Mycobacterium noviomagense]
QDVPIRAEVASLDNLSAHADADEILAWMRGFTQTPRRTFVTHGEPEAADALRARIDHELGWSVAVPEYLQTVDLV